MKQAAGVLVAVLMVFCVLATGQDGLSLGFWADKHAPYICTIGSHSFGFGFGIDWELGMWWYRCETTPPPSVCAAIEPRWEAELLGGWRIEVAVSIRCETTCPNDRWKCGELEAAVVPCVLLFHPW